MNSSLDILDSLDRFKIYHFLRQQHNMNLKRLFCNFLQRVGVRRPRYSYESCCLRSGLSIGGNEMAIRRFKHFLWKEKHIFCDFVKSEGETAKTQLKSCQKKDFLKVNEATFLQFPSACMGLTTTLYI